MDKFRTLNNQEMSDLTNEVFDLLMKRTKGSTLNLLEISSALCAIMFANFRVEDKDIEKELILRWVQDIDKKINHLRQPRPIH